MRDPEVENRPFEYGGAACLGRICGLEIGHLVGG